MEEAAGWWLVAAIYRKGITQLTKLSNNSTHIHLADSHIPQTVGGSRLFQEFMYFWFLQL